MNEKNTLDLYEKRIEIEFVHYTILVAKHHITLKSFTDFLNLDYPSVYNKLKKLNHITNINIDNYYLVVLTFNGLQSIIQEYLGVYSNLVNYLKFTNAVYLAIDESFNLNQKDDKSNVEERVINLENKVKSLETKVQTLVNLNFINSLVENKNDLEEKVTLLKTEYKNTTTVTSNKSDETLQDKSVDYQSMTLDEQRTYLNLLVKQKSVNYNHDIHKTWNELYFHVNRHLRIRIKERAKNRNMSPIEYAYHYDMLNSLIDVAITKL